MGQTLMDYYLELADRQESKESLILHDLQPLPLTGRANNGIVMPGSFSWIKAFRQMFSSLYEMMQLSKRPEKREGKNSVMDLWLQKKNFARLHQRVFKDKQGGSDSFLGGWSEQDPRSQAVGTGQAKVKIQRSKGKPGRAKVRHKDKVKQTVAFPKLAVRRNVGGGNRTGSLCGYS